MNTIMQTLKGKVAGIPIWLIVVVVTGGAFWYIRKNSAKATADGTEGNTDNSYSGLDQTPNGLPIMQFTNIYTGTGTTVPPQTTTPPTSSPTGGGNTSPVVTPTGPVTGVTPGTPAGHAPVKPPTKTNSLSYKVQSGDNLTRIAQKYGVKESALYNANKTLIENQAKQHGYKSSDQGHWIFPGEKLVIPA